MTISILLVDDHGVLRAGLRALLNAEADLQVVGEAASAEEALRLADDLRPDVVLLDIGLPDMNGLDVTRLLTRQLIGVRVVLLTVHDDQALVREALQAGAAGYVVKRAVESELIDAIRAAAAGHLYIHPTLTRALLNHDHPRPGGAQHAGPGAAGQPLTAREAEVLQLIAQGYTNRQIAGLLDLSTRTVESHRASLRAKLELRSRADLVRYAARYGLLQTGSSGPSGRTTSAGQTASGGSGGSSGQTTSGGPTTSATSGTSERR